jgi:hypothetical protein
MYQLICDRCGKKVDTDERIVEIALEENYYKGNTEFFHDYRCLNQHLRLCEYCSQQLFDFLNFAVDRLAF